MRLAIQLQCKHLNLPISYKHIIQGTIYNMLSKEELGDFYHNQGYKRNEKKFKLFVFSDLYGKYKIENKRIVFEDIIKFYVSSLDNKFIKCIYEYLCNNENLFINKQIVKIVGVDFIGVDSFVGDKELIIKTLSPIVAYSTENKYVSYYKPSDLEFIKLVKENIISKVSAYQYPINDIVFEIKDVIKENKKIVYFKNTFYEAYQCEMKIKVNFDTLKLILETGLSAKGSCGFGMVYQKMKKTFYLYKNGELSRRDNSLVLKEKNNSVTYIPIEQVNIIVCFSEIILNKRVLSLLNTYQVTILFYNYYGNYIGRYTPKKYSDGKIIIEQVESFQNEKRLIIAKQIVYTEIRNILSLLKYYDKKEHLFLNDIQRITNALGELENIMSVDALLLFEAKIKKEYYSCFDMIIKNKLFIFRQRSFHPPLNEVNALMSYGYAILYSNILSDLDRSPLIPQISYIHSLSKESDSLQFDIADMLKPVFIDRLIFRMINKNQIKVSYFEYKDDGTCFINKEGVKVFLNEYEKLQEKSVKIGNKYYSYRNLITREVYKLAHFIEGKSKEYKPYIMEW